MKNNILLISLIIFFVFSTSAFGWNQRKVSFSKDGYVYYFIQCNSGSRWDLVQRPDGWIKVNGISYSYSYNSLSNAAAKLCKE